MRKPEFQRSAMVLAAAVMCGGVGAAVPTGSPYHTDPQSSYVQDATSDAIGQVNMITCFMSAMLASQMVNAGDYVALVDEAKCDGNRQSSTDAGASAAQYTRAVVNSSRASGSDPMQVKVWVEMEDQGQQNTISVRTSATSSPTESNPYGVFRMDFAAPGPGNNYASPMFQGYIDAGAGGLSFVQNEQGGGGGGPNLSRLFLNSNGTSAGIGAVSFFDHFSSQSKTYTFGYDANFFRRSDGMTDKCFSRDMDDAKTSVWRYGLYDSTTGERVDLNSGFPVTASVGGQTHQGYASYYGLQFPGPVLSQLSTGATITRQSFGAGAGTDYSLVKAGGRLTKYVRNSRTLASIDGMRFMTFVPSGVASGWGVSGPALGQQLEMYWDEASGSFVVSGYQVCGQNGCLPTAITPVSVSRVTVAGSMGFGLNGWAQSLGGELTIPGDTLNASSSAVYYRTSSLVYPDSPDLAGNPTFYCVSNCPTASSLGAFASNPGNSPYALAHNFSPTAAGAVVSYSFNTSTGVLENNSAAAVLPGSVTAEDLSGTPYQWGIRSGRLVTSLSEAECPGIPSQYCDNSAGGASVYYQWETGPNNWNQFAALKNGSTFLQFDAPLQVSYNVPNDVSAYGDSAGRTLVLQYGGFGNLWGIPGHCVRPVDNAIVDCGSAGQLRYVPAFSIPQDEASSRVSVGGTQYLVKWLDRETRFGEVASSNCSALTLGSTSNLPSASGLLNPANPAAAEYIGERPSITAAPRVIHGERKY